MQRFENNKSFQRQFKILTRLLANSFKSNYIVLVNNKQKKYYFKVFHNYLLVNFFKTIMFNFNEVAKVLLFKDTYITEENPEEKSNSNYQKL